MVIVVENLKAGKENHSGSENEECYLFKAEFYIICGFWQTYKRNSHLLRKMEGNIDKGKILYFMLFFQSSIFDPKLSQVKPEICMPQIENSSSSSQQAQSTGLTTQPDVSCHSELQTIFKLKQMKILPPKAVAPHSSTLAWKIPWMEEPGGLQSMGSLRVGPD